MKTIKKPVSILLSLIMIVSLFTIVPFTASAASNGNFGNLSWNLDDNGVLTFSGSGAIPNYGFDWTNQPIKKIIINDSVTAIGDCAFRGCTQLKEVVFESNPVLDWDSFPWCSALESVTLPQNMETIGRGMFRGCTSLKTIELPATIKKIGMSAFNQSGLESLTVPEGVEIEEDAFEECASLQSLVLESSTPVSYQAGYLTTLGNVTTVTVSEGSHYDRKARTDYNLTLKEGAEIPGWMDAEDVAHLVESANWTFNDCIEQGMSEEEALAEASDSMPLSGIELELHKTEIEAYDQIFRTGDTCPDVFGGATLKVALDDAVEKHVHDGITFDKWTSDNSLPTAAGNYVLTSDVTLSGTWTVPEGDTNLCLAGYTIRQSVPGSVIQLNNVNAKLTVYDDGTTGTITGGNTDGNGGGVNITEGTFTLKGGNIEGNVAGNGGGVSVFGKSSYFIMAGGTVRYNAGYTYTGGVLQIAGHFTMTGGTIQNNVGKVYGGVGIADRAQPSMSGNAVVKDNVIFTDISATNTKITKTESGYMIASGGTPCDVKHADALKINVIGAFENGAQIGITMDNPGVFTNTDSDKTSFNDPTKFFSDNSAYGVLKNTDGQLYLGVPPVASVTDGSTVTYYSSLKDAITAAPNGSTVTLLKDVTETQTAYANNNDTYGGTGNVISGKTITITSNGTGSDRKTVTGSRFDVINGGNVTFTNIIIDGGVADSAHKITSHNSWSNYFMAVSYGSTLTFDTGATVQNYYAAAHGVIDVGNGRRGNLDTSNGSSTINIKDGSEFKNLGANYGVFREDYKSTINMSGGSVTNCTSFANEGVCAYVAQGSAFNMTGGEITGCSPEGSAPGLIFLHDGQANGNNKFTMTGGTISGNTAKLGGAVYSHNVNNTVTVGGSAVATGNTGTDINNGQSGSSNFYLAAGQTMTFVNDNHLSGDSLIGIYSATAPTDSADVKIATGAVKEDIKHIHSDLPGNAGIIYCDGEKDWIWYNNQFVEVSCHHTSHQGGTVWLSTAVNTYEVIFDTDGGTPATIPAQTVVSNSKATKPADPTKDGYVFDGWYNGDTEFDFDTPITAETNLKAKWSVPVASVTVGGTTTEYTDFAEAVNAWVNNSTLTLLANVTTSGVIRFESGVKTLDLNGYGIKNTSANIDNSNSVIFIRGSGTQLTLQDSRPNETTHYFTAPAGNAGLATDISDIDSGDQQSFHGGYLTGGDCFSGGGIRVDNGANLIMTGGTIIGNRGQYGGGIDVEKSGSAGGSATISGGAIMYNYGTKSDGAIHTNTANYVSVSNCKITNNYAEHGAGGAYKSSINGGFSGNLIIKDNKTGNTECNLLIESNQYISLTSALGENASIGITMNNPGVFTNSSTTDYNVASKFKSDNVNYKVVKNADGQLELRKALFVGHTITLNGDIGVNFFINSAYADFANAQTATVTFTWDKGNYTKEVNLKALTPDGNGHYKATCDVVAAHMAHKIHAVVYLNGTALDETDAFSVQDYAEELFNHPKKYDTKGRPVQLRALAKALLNYGAMAQTMFDKALKEKPDLANKNVGATDLEAVTAEKVTAAIKDANNQDTGADMKQVAADLHANWFTTTVIYLSKNTVKHYFTKADDSFNASAYQGDQNNYYYFVQKENIPAAELDTLQEFKVGDDYTFKYSALDYVVAVINSNMADNAKNIAKALFLYNQAANAYFD